MKIIGIGLNGVTFFNEDVKAEAESRGHTYDFSHSNSLNVDFGPDEVDVRAGEFNLKEYDLIHVGSLSSNRWPLLAAFEYLNRETSCKVVDGYLVDSTLGQYSGSYKYYVEHEHGVNLPRSIVFKRVKDITDRLSQFKFPVIVKTNASRQGKGVGIAHNIEEIEKFVKDRVSKDKAIAFVLRELIPNDGDYRVNVIDGKAVNCLKRTPQGDEFRSNIALGGIMTNVLLKDAKEICAIAEKISKLLRFDIAGVDVMVNKETGVPYILEVNRAPGSLEDDVKASGVDMAKLIVDLYEKRVG